jgi:MFS family permease
MLVGLRLVLGAAEAFFFVAALAALLDLAPPDRAGEALSFNSLALYIGIAAGPLIGEALLGIGGFDLGWIGAAALALTAAILALRLPETVAPGAAEGPLVIVNRAAAGPSLALFVGIMGMSGFLALVAIYARESLALDGAGVVLLLYGGVVVVCRIAFASLPDRIDPARLMTIALTLVAIGLGTMGLIATLPGLAVGTVILAVGVAFLTPAVFAAVYRRVDASERGSAAGTISLFIDFAFIGGPAIFGYIAGSVAIPIAFLVGAIVAGVGSVGTLLFVRSTRSTISAT